MTAFARSDVMGITIPQEAGGCGELHSREITNMAALAKDKKGEVAPEYAEGEFGVTCVYCEPILIADHGWSRNPDEVELTPDETRAKERAEKEGTAATNAMAAAIGKELATAAREGLLTPQ